MTGRAAALAVVVSACAGDASITAVELRLRDEAPACLAVQVAMVKSVEVIAVGEAAGGADCQLDRACVEVSPTTSVTALDAQLAAAPTPLLDVPTAALRSVRVRGLSQQACGGEVQLCGVADLAAATAGHLDVAVVCDNRLAGRCPTATLPPCP